MVLHMLIVFYYKLPIDFTEKQMKVYEICTWPTSFWMIYFVCWCMHGGKMDQGEKAHINIWVSSETPTEG